MKVQTHRSASRSRRLTKSEAAKYHRIREQVMQEIPPAKPAPMKVAIAKLRAMRQTKGISLAELAARMGIAETKLARLELRKKATMQTLQQYAEGLDCDLQINVVAAVVSGNQKPQRRQIVGS